MNSTKAAERQRYIKAHRVEVNRFAGVTDVVEILRLIHEPPPPDPLVVLVAFGRPTSEVYRALSQNDADRLVAVAANSSNMLHTVASHLACFAAVDLESCQHALLAQQDPYPAHAFRGASDSVVDALFDLLDQSVRGPPQVLLDHTLSALAWARSPRVIEAFVTWSNQFPPWSHMLYIPPDAYARVAGYEIEGGAVRDLTLARALKLEPSDVALTGPADVSLFVPDTTGLLCPRCARPATILLRFESTDLPEQLRGLVPVSVPTCLDCAPHEPLFVQQRPDATWAWLASDGPAAGGDEGWRFSPRRARLVPRPPSEAIDWCQADGASQIGGHPAWINDPEYPPCPGCHRSTATVVQVALEDFFQAEGIFYVHYCSECAVAGVSYQQS